MSLATIAASFDAFAEAELKNVKNDALELLAKGVEDTGAELVTLVDQTGAAATTLVTNLMGDDSLSGLEKANLAATQLVEQYALKGIAVADADATYVIKNAYEAVAAKLRSLES